MGSKRSKHLSDALLDSLDDNVSSMELPAALASKKRAAGGQSGRKNPSKRVKISLSKPEVIPPAVAAAAAAAAAADKWFSSKDDERPSEESGTSRFNHRCRGLTQEMVDGQLLGFGPIDLGAKPGDYDRVRVYTESSSSDETDMAREAAYRVARSLGFPAGSQVVLGVDINAVGGFPPKNEATARFLEACSRSFRLPQAERDLLKEDRATLTEAAEYHMFQVSP